jgi:type IV pilus assembly protein PilX
MMKKGRMKSNEPLKTCRNERGAALVIALVLLALMTVIGIAATDQSQIEQTVSAAHSDYASAFYAAEAGIDQAKANLRTLFLAQSQAAVKVNVSAQPDWDFALVDATTANPKVTWIDGGSDGGSETYTVTIWNNADGGSANNDTDGVIFLQSVGKTANGAKAVVEIMLNASVGNAGAIQGYSAQAGAGSGKAYASEDQAAIASDDLGTAQGTF